MDAIPRDVNGTTTAAATAAITSESTATSIVSNAAGQSYSEQSLNFFSYVNIHGLKPKTVPSKIPYIADVLSANHQLFVGLSETWLKDHKDAELAIEGYKLYRSDRSRNKATRRGRDSGGVAFYLRNDLSATCAPIFQFTNGVTEILALYSKAENLILITVYRQPDDEAHPSKSNEFEGAINKLRDTLL